MCTIEATVWEWTARNSLRDTPEDASGPESREDASEWAEVEDTILKALLPFAEAKAAVTKALAALMNSP